MPINKSDQDSFFTPKSFYNLNSMGLGVWILCIVIGSIYTDLTPVAFRIIALLFSLLFAISHFWLHPDWRKPAHYMLILLNAASIYVNASGINAITYSSRLQKGDTKTRIDSISQANLFAFAEQKNWWPDYSLIEERDSLIQQTQILDREKQRLLNEFSLLKDELNTVIKDKKTRDTVNQILRNYGSYKMDTADLAYLKFSHSKQLLELNHTIDSLRLKEKEKVTTYITIGKREMSAEMWADTLLDYYNRSNQMFEDINVALSKDSAFFPIRNYIQKYRPVLKE